VLGIQTIQVEEGKIVITILLKKGGKSQTTREIAPDQKSYHYTASFTDAKGKTVTIHRKFNQKYASSLHFFAFIFFLHSFLGAVIVSLLIL
jgi:hypothetical protein